MVARPPVPLVERLDPAANLARDEELLRLGGPSLRVAILTSPAVSTGIGRPLDPAARRASELAGLPVLVRGSGGGALLHLPGDLVWSLVVPRSHPLAGPGFAEGYPRLGAGVVRFLEARGVRATWAEPFDVSESYCLLSSRGRVLVAGGRALGGAAQHLSATELLHHGVLPRRVDRDRIRELFGLGPELVERLVGLEELDVEGDADELARGLRDALADQLHGDSRAP